MLAPRDIIRVVAAQIRRTLLHWPIVLIATMIAVPVAYFAPKILPPVYTSETLVLYEEVIQTDNVLGAQQYATESRRQMGMRLREMLLSRTNLELIIGEYNLYPDIVASRGMVDAVEEFRNKIDCRVRENETFRIAYQGEDPVQVFNVTEALSKSLVEQNSQYRSGKAEATKQFLAEEQRRMSIDLADKEQNLAEFLAQHPEFAQDVATSANPTGASIRAATRSGVTEDNTVGAIDRQLARLRAQLNSPRPVSMASVSPSVDPKAAAAVDAAQANLSEAQRELSSLQSKYTDSHPDVTKAARRVAEANAALSQARAAARATMSAPASAAPPPMNDSEARDKIRADILRLEAERSRAKRGSGPGADTGSGEESTVVTLETTWSSLNRELTEAREQHEQIQTRLFRASMVASVEASGQASQMVVVDQAYEPKRPARRGPNRTKAIAGAIVVALGMAIAFALGLFDDRVFDENDAKKLELGPILHVIPRAKKTDKQKRG